jgi:type II secretion system protein N
VPRLLRRVAIPLAGLVLVLFFVYLGFPYDPLASRVAAEAGIALAARVDIREVGPRVGLAGPGFEARGVRVTWPGSAPLEIERLAVRPAWSLAWLRGDPAIHAELEGAAGSLEGVWRSSGGWEGEVRDLDLSAVPLERLLPGLAPQGRLDARVDLSWRDAAPQGAVAFEATEGSLLLPDVPMPLPYARCRGELVFGNGALLSVESFALEGPLLSASASGRIGHAERFASAPLQLELQLSAVQPALQPLLRSAGVSLDRQGSASLRLTGTPGAPQLR